MDTAIHKGKPFWSGVFDANDGFIREVHPYKRAKAADFHHSYYVSSQSQDAMKQGDAGFFWVDPDGSVNTDWREGKAPKHIVDAIQDQIEPIPHKDNGGGVTDPNTDVPPSPGESPIPEGNVRLYHQTAASNIPSILKNGITFENAKGIEGPKAIYADEKGFYGKPGKVPTIEFSIPKERWTHPPFVLGDVKPSEIVAAHLPWHETVRYLEEFPDQIKRTLQGEHDNLMDGSGSNEDKAVRYIKQKYKPHKDNGGSVTLYHGTGKTIDKFKPHTYFATAPETSKKYATYRRGPNPQTYRVEANLTRPAKMADYRAAKEELGNSAVNEDVFSYLQSKGFDHFIPYSGEVVVFDPEKSTKPKFDNGGGITAYQGGPHSVGEEGFLDEKIGTGEGAQAYGHGHYFAEAEPVAQGYRDALVQKRNPTTSINDLIGQMSKNSPESRTPKNIQWYMKQDPMLSPHADDKEVVGHISEALNGQNADGSVSESAIDAYGKLTDKFGRNHKGHMHEVSINAHPDHMLDWDKTIDEQSDYVKNALNKTEWWPWTEERIEDRAGRHGSNPQGRHLYEDLVEDYSPEEASKFLQDSGIHGIRYLDANSRSKGEGTRNYVVFDPKRVDIKRRYKDGGDVDDDGGITAYHGSPHDFDEFDTSKIGGGSGAQNFGHGLYFAEHEPAAEGYRYSLQQLANVMVGKEDANQINKGHMYEVNINAHPDHMLDWDKTLSEQSPHIVKSIFDARKDNPTLFNVFKSHYNKNSTGMVFYQSLATHHPNGYQGASEFLQRSGIHGVKYRDVTRQGMKDEKPTTNYVVFDPKNVDVKRKYEQGGEVLHHGGRIGYDYGGDVRTGDNPGGAADANRPAATSSYAEHNLNAGSGTQTAGPSSDNRPDNRPDNSNDRFNIGGGNAPMPPQRGDDSFFGNMGGNIGSVLGGLAFGPLGSIGGRYLGNQFNQPDNSRFEAKNDEFGNPIGNSGGWLDFLGNSGNPPAPMTSDNRRDPIKRKRRILMPDGTYQEVEEGMKLGGVAKSYNRVHNSKIVEHALSKVGVSLHTRRPPS